jgi:group I intron endonuclease
MGYIYRITNTVNGKVYIGQTKQHDFEKRWSLHKQSIKWKKGGCPLLKAAMLKYGVEHFKFEVIIICFDADLMEMEKEYIVRYNSVTPNGYNILPGGQGGGGFKGKKHTPETIKKIKIHLKALYESKPELRKAQSERAIVSNAKYNIGELVTNSKKYKKALAEGRVGSAGWILSVLPEKKKEVYKKVSDSLKEYYLGSETSSTNIDKHRKLMAEAVGMRVSSYRGNTHVKNYPSIAEAARDISVNPNAIKRALKNSDLYTCKGLSWRYTP